MPVLGQLGSGPWGEGNELLSYMQHIWCFSLYSIPQRIIQSNLNVTSSSAPITFPGMLFCRLTHLTICVFFSCEICEQLSIHPNPLISLIFFYYYFFSICYMFSFPSHVSCLSSQLLSYSLILTGHEVWRFQNAYSEVGFTCLKLDGRWKGLYATCNNWTDGCYLENLMVSKLFLLYLLESLEIHLAVGLGLQAFWTCYNLWA